MNFLYGLFSNGLPTHELVGEEMQEQLKLVLGRGRFDWWSRCLGLMKHHLRKMMSCAARGTIGPFPLAGPLQDFKQHDSVGCRARAKGLEAADMDLDLVIKAALL